MTIEDDRGQGPGGESVPMSPRRSRVASRDLERYAALFAERTRVMTSSAMRDLMAITERPEVISLAGGLPDTSTFPADDFAAIMGRIGTQTARALQYGPTDGLAGTKEAIAAVMAAEDTPVDPDDLLVTTGGQHACELARGHDVETAAGLGEGLQNRQVGVGFDGVADQVLAALQGALVGSERRQHGAAAVLDGVEPQAVELGPLDRGRYDKWRGFCFPSPYFGEANCIRSQDQSPYHDGTAHLSLGT